MSINCNKYQQNITKIFNLFNIVKTTICLMGHTLKTTKMLAMVVVDGEDCEMDRW